MIIDKKDIHIKVSQFRRTSFRIILAGLLMCMIGIWGNKFTWWEYLILIIIGWMIFDWLIEYDVNNWLKNDMKVSIEIEGFK